MRRKIIIIGAAGRDFRNFNTGTATMPLSEVVCVHRGTDSRIGGRRYPFELAGSLYPDGIPIYAEDQLSPPDR